MTDTDTDTAAARLRQILAFRDQHGRHGFDFDDDDVTAVLDEHQQLAARVAELQAQRDAQFTSLPIPVLRQAWRNGWTDRASAMRQTVADTNEQRDAYERAFARYMSEDLAEADKDPYRPLDGPGDPAAERQPESTPCDTDCDCDCQPGQPCLCPERDCYCGPCPVCGPAPAAALGQQDGVAKACVCGCPLGQSCGCDDSADHKPADGSAR